MLFFDALTQRTFTRWKKDGWDGGKERGVGVGDEGVGGGGGGQRTIHIPFVLKVCM